LVDSRFSEFKGYKSDEEKIQNKTNVDSTSSIKIEEISYVKK